MGLSVASIRPKARSKGKGSVFQLKQIIPEIYVKDCLDALHFYKDLFGGEIKNLQMSEDIEMFKQISGKVVHAELHVNSRCVFYFVDIFEKKRAAVGNVTLVLHMHTKQEMQQAFDRLKEGGLVGMEMQRTFWGEYHAIVTDRFGAPWALNFTPKKKTEPAEPVA